MGVDPLGVDNSGKTRISSATYSQFWVSKFTTGILFLTEKVQKYKTDIANFVSSQPFNLIELGAGDGRKTKILIFIEILQFLWVILI